MFKGIFVFKNGPSIKSLRKQKVVSGKPSVVCDHDNKAWYKTYRKQWKQVEEKIEVSKEITGKNMFLLTKFIILENSI